MRRCIGPTGVTPMRSDSTLVLPRAKDRFAMAAQHPLSPEGDWIVALRQVMLRTTTHSVRALGPVLRRDIICNLWLEFVRGAKWH
jgi:hypothetical protein